MAFSLSGDLPVSVEVQLWEGYNEYPMYLNYTESQKSSQNLIIYLNVKYYTR
jgi:hypothetical protein